MTLEMALGQVLQLQKPSVVVEDHIEYPFAGVKSFGGGVFRSAVKKGSEFSYRRLTRVRTDNFVYPKLMAWEGALGVVPQECDGLVVSPEFCVFTVESDHVLPRWLDLYFKQASVWPRLAGGSAGTNVRRRRIYPKDFLQWRVPLPSLEEQHRTVKLFDIVACQIAAASKLREEADALCNTLIEAFEKTIWPEVPIWPQRNLASVTSHLSRGRQSEQGDSQHTLIKTQHVQAGRYVRSLLKLSPVAAARVKEGSCVRQGDILIACSAAGCLGRTACFEGVGVVASTDTHVAIVRANPEFVSSDYLYAYLRGARGQYELRRRERGDWRREKVGFRLTELNVNELRAVPVPVPSPEEQKHVVSRVQAFRSAMFALAEAQDDTGKELDAVLPALLNKVFSM